MSDAPLPLFDRLAELIESSMFGDLAEAIRVLDIVIGYGEARWTVERVERWRQVRGTVWPKYEAACEDMLVLWAMVDDDV